MGLVYSIVYYVVYSLKYAVGVNCMYVFVFVFKRYSKLESSGFRSANNNSSKEGTHFFSFLIRK